LGLAVLATLAISALFADALAAMPDEQHLLERLDAPAWTGGEHGYVFGSDQLGRDELARMVHGARVSLTVGIVGVALSGGVGVTLGLIAGYLGGVADRVIMRVARELLGKLRAARRVPARLLGVALSSLAQDPEADQLTLFDSEADPLAETERDRLLVRTVDRVREKFGPKSILPASLAEE
jgi:ABC-type antimicrobial peptide transport system permease subunit